MQNWKTTLIGFGAGCMNQYVGGMSWKNSALSAFIALLGAFAKDHSSSGTTKF